MTSHELAGIIGIVAIWTTLGAFFAGYYFAKRKSKKNVEKSSENTSVKQNNTEKENSVPKKRFDWI